MMNKNNNIKEIIFLILGFIFMIGTISMIGVDIAGSIFYAIISILFFYLGKNIIIYKDNTKEENKLFCTKCGKRIANDSNYCIFCGNATNSKNDINKKQIQNTEKEIEQKQQEYNENIKIKQMEVEYQQKLKELENQLKEYKATEPSDLEIQITINKIQEIYKEYGFNVKVIDIRKNKYDTEYEIIFPIENTQDEICNISKNILEEFKLDGTNIRTNNKRIRNKRNRIILSVPYECKLV